VSKNVDGDFNARLADAYRLLVAAAQREICGDFAEAIAIYRQIQQKHPHKRDFADQQVERIRRQLSEDLRQPIGTIASKHAKQANASLQPAMDLNSKKQARSTWRYLAIWIIVYIIATTGVGRHGRRHAKDMAIKFRREAERRERQQFPAQDQFRWQNLPPVVAKGGPEDGVLPLRVDDYKDVDATKHEENGFVIPEGNQVGEVIDILPGKPETRSELLNEIELPQKGRVFDDSAGQEPLDTNQSGQ